MTPEARLDWHLKVKTGLITGAAQGIGLAAAFESATAAVRNPS